MMTYIPIRMQTRLEVFYLKTSFIPYDKVNRKSYRVAQKRVYRVAQNNNKNKMRKRCLKWWVFA